MAKNGRIKKIKFHYEGFNELRKSPEIAGDLHRRGEAIAQAAGGGEDFVVIDAPSSSRARAIVATATVDGMLAEARDRSLTRALDAGRG